MTPVTPIRQSRLSLASLAALICVLTLGVDPALADKGGGSLGGEAPLGPFELVFPVDVALPLDDFDSDICRDQVGENHLTRVNRPPNCIGPIAIPDGRISMAVELDGVSEYLYQDYDPDSGIAGQGEASFDRSLKFKLNEHPAPGLGSALLWSSNDGAATGMYAVVIRDVADAYSFVQVKMSGELVRMDQIPNRINDNDWHHVRVKYDGGIDKFTVTVDANIAYQQTSNIVSSVANTQPVYIGRKPAPQYHLNGCVADLYCLNGANWSSAEAAQLSGYGVWSTYPFLTYAQSLQVNETYLTSGLADEASPSLWKLDEASGTRVDSIGPNDFTQHGDVGYAPGLLQGTDAASFDGIDDYLERLSADCVGIDELLDGDWTLTFWVYFDALPSANGQNVIIMDKINPADETGWEVFALGNDTPDHFGAKVRNGVLYRTATIGPDMANDIITDCWYQLLFQYEFSTRQFTITINNEITAANTIDPPGIVASSNPLLAGCSHGYAKLLEGRMQQIVLYPRILSDNQKSDLYNFGFGMPIIACPADVNHDGVVNIDDLFQLLGVWGPCWFCEEDLNGDGKVNIDDLFIVLGAWGTCP
ncbi:MAG: hypothetical protein JSV91_08435 [Phycisphaerales bacterium]|nr:MAG: hypothetical protein JSV91_08435 [Phycisphaerales bacterium]